MIGSGMLVVIGVTRVSGEARVEEVVAVLENAELREWDGWW